MKYTLLLIFIFSNAVHALEVDQQWLNLLRYEKSFFGNYQSQVINKEFFISDKGNKEPQIELNETLNYIKKNKNDFLCRFPARSAYLQKKGVLKNPTFKHCKDYLYFKRKIDPNSVAIVFASYYINNPSSMFGHTFLKLNKKGKSSNNDLLHWGANFAANVTSSNPLIYGVYGITGGFSANYSLLPYYFKVREYAESESREMWEYHLKISDEKLDFFVAHLWEMEKALFNYYYFNGNCSSQIINFLSAVYPEKNLHNSLPTFVIPSQTIRIIEEYDLIKEVRFRPSNFQKISLRWDGLKAEEKKAFSAFKKDPLTYKLSGNESINMLDIFIDYLDFKFPVEVAKGDKNSYATLKHNILIERSQKEGKTEKLNLIKSDALAPHKAHKERMLPLGYRHFKKQKALSFGYRFSLHNIMDPSLGYSKLGGQEMGNIEALYLTKSKKFRLSRFTLVNIDTYPQLLSFAPKVGWSLRGGVKDYFDTDHFEKAPFIKHGLNFNLSKNESIIFAPEIHYSAGYAESFSGNNIRIDLMPGLSLFSDALRAKFKLKYFYNHIIGPNSLDHHVYQAVLNIPLSQNLSWKSQFSKWVSKEKDKEDFTSEINFFF
ncbi:MAG: DUF4105 domain-containing protein [Oligoflexia bacterium]|nr:DUF4105 domain-containing protein [Oligoflexia bacterium]